MEAQLHHTQDTGLHSGEGQGQVHDEGEHYHKKSVLKKVKAKAKKIKDHLKHGLGHEHDHDHDHEHHPPHSDEEEEEESDEEEMEEGAEVHGGPYAVRSKDIRKEDVVPMANLENPTSPKEDRYDSKMKNEQMHRPILHRQDEFARPPSLERTHFPEERHKPPFAETHETERTDYVTAHGNQGLQGHENIGASTVLEDHHSPHFREPAHRPATTAETHEIKGFDHVTAHGKLRDQGLQGHKIGVATGIEEDPHAPKDRSELSPNPTNYQSKVIDPTGANNEEAGVGPLVQSFDKMVVNDDPETRPEPRAGDIEFDQGTEHIPYTGSHGQFAPQEAPAYFPSVGEDTEQIPKSMNPRKTEDLPQDTLTGKSGSYSEKIPSATTVIADKAVAVKDAVASMLGYGGTEEGTNKSCTTESNNETEKMTSVAQKHASTVAEKVASVYEKVAGAGSIVMEKVQGTATGVTGHESRGGADAEHEVKTKPTDKGVSMKEYLAEKFKPGEEDKALSEVISGSLSRQKDKTEETGETKLMGKVTESEEVKRRLGPIEDTKKEDDGASRETKAGEGFGQGVVDRLKGAVSTWLGKGGETQTSSGISNDSAVDGGAVVGGRG